MQQSAEAVGCGEAELKASRGEEGEDGEEEESRGSQVEARSALHSTVRTDPGLWKPSPSSAFRRSIGLNVQGVSFPLETSRPATWGELGPLSRAGEGLEEKGPLIYQDAMSGGRPLAQAGLN